MPLKSIQDAPITWSYKNVSDVWSLLGTVRISQLRTLLLMALLNILKLNSKPSYLCLIAFSSHWEDVGDDTSETFLYDHVIGASCIDFSGIIVGTVSRDFYIGLMLMYFRIALS